MRLNSFYNNEKHSFKYIKTECKYTDLTKKATKNLNKSNKINKNDNIFDLKNVLFVSIEISKNPLRARLFLIGAFSSVII